MPEPIQIPMKIKTGDPPVLEDVNQWLLLPRVLFAHIYHKLKEVWQRRFVRDAEQLQGFWDCQADNPQFQQPDILSHRSSMRQRCIPLRMHSDGIVVTGRGRSWSKMLDVFSWGLVLGWGQTDTMLNFRSTDEELANLLRWSFTALWEGHWPKRDHTGNEFPIGSRAHDLPHGTDTFLAEGYYALLRTIESDLDVLAVFWNFPRVGSATPCAYCPSTNRLGPMPFDNFDVAPPAPWMPQIRSLEYMRDHLEIFPNPMYSIPGVTALTVCSDWMPTKYLGTDQYCLGSVLFTLCNHLMCGSPEEIVRRSGRRSR